jgi:hypothetical protein
MVEMKGIPFVPETLARFSRTEMIDAHLPPDHFAGTRDFYPLHETFSHANVV